MWLLVAAEEREFAGVVRRASRIQTLPWPGVAFARQIEWAAGNCMLVANGPGPRLARDAVRVRDSSVTGLMSVGFCGALDPALMVGDIVVSGDCPETKRRDFVRAEIVSVDRVAVTSDEKFRLREKTGASAVDMESAAVQERAREWGVRFCCVRTVSDMAREDMPLDFNRYRDGDGRFSRRRIALAALAHPSAIAGLVRLNRNCEQAAESLGEFLADCQL